MIQETMTVKTNTIIKSMTVSVTRTNWFGSAGIKYTAYSVLGSLYYMWADGMVALFSHDYVNDFGLLLATRYYRTVFIKRKIKLSPQCFFTAGIETAS